MPLADSADLPTQFQQLLAQCRQLYRSSAELAAHEHPQQLEGSAEQFIALMDDLHRALLVKIFVAVCQCDRHWSPNEVSLADALIRHLWNQRLEGDKLRETILEMSVKATALKWYALVRPFDQIAALRNRIGELETIVSRIANVAARADGPIQPIEAAQIKSIQQELSRHLRPIPIDQPSEHAEAERAAPEAIANVLRSADKLPPGKPDAGRSRDKLPAASSSSKKLKPSSSSPDAAAPSAKPAAERLAEALAELDRLIGLADVKQEVRTLANFLKVQAKRSDAGLPTAELSLHMTFAGNPGVGKTTVGRIVGNVFGAMGVLKKGHLVETDRSGLVAEYAGQTAPKTQQKIDEALDGVLFIDEAYALVAAKNDDPYGHEAVQTLLKRMEDDRDRLVVILAGYPQEMETLLRSNPGLSSRFSRQLEFADYSPLELACIFGMLCEQNQYRLCWQTRAKIIVGLTWLHGRRDRRFGNGRTVRNLFEYTIRRHANRIAELTELSIEQLTTLEPGDVEFEDCPAETMAPLTDSKLRLRIECLHCGHGKAASPKLLGEQVRCPKCSQEFEAAWATLTPPPHKRRSET